MKGIRYKFIYDNLSALQFEYSDGTVSPLIGSTHEKDSTFLPCAKLDVETPIRNIVVKYWKDAQLSSDDKMTYKTTDRIAAIEFYDSNSDVIAELKSDKLSIHE